MVNLSFMERLNVIKAVILNSGKMIYIVPAILAVMLIIMALSFKKKNKMTFVSILIYMIVLGLLAYIYNGHLITMYDYLVGYIVDYVLFPNLAIYIGMLIITNLMVFISLLDKDIKYSIKNINVLFFTLISLVQVFIVRCISINNIDIYEKLTVYSNQELLVLIEFSMILFLIWVLSLLTIKLINYITSKLVNRNNDTVIETEEHAKLFGSYALKVQVIDNQMIPDYSNIAVNKYTFNQEVYNIEETIPEMEIYDYNKALNNLNSFDDEDYIPVKKKVQA